MRLSITEPIFSLSRHHQSSPFVPAPAHDLEIKSAKVIEFLKEGRPVRVSVSFTMSVWSKEEPARREVLARVVQQVRARYGMFGVVSS